MEVKQEFTLEQIADLLDKGAAWAAEGSVKQSVESYASIEDDALCVCALGAAWACFNKLSPDNVLRLADENIYWLEDAVRDWRMDNMKQRFGDEIINMNDAQELTFNQIAERFRDNFLGPI